MPEQLNRFLPLIVLIVIVSLTQNWSRLELLLNPVDSTAFSEHDVVLYSTSWCPYCRQTREYLQQANIPFTEHDIEKNARAYQQYTLLSGRGVPVISIGSRTIQGYDKIAMRSALDALSQEKKQ